MERSCRVFYYGTDRPTPEVIPLRAGPLTMILEPETGFLRYIRLGDEELLRGIYGAVRDRNWGTVPPQIRTIRLERSAHGFSAQFEVECVEGEIDFVWAGHITGRDDGTVVYRMDGTARSSFLCNRIGLCVLHPASCAGRPCRAMKVDGSTEDTFFPREISPHQPFLDLRALSHEVQPGLWARVDFEGDVFEMEDQRNWTDASFKTYSRPLRLPFPVRVDPGTRVLQSVTLTLERRGGPVAALSPLAPGASPAAGVVSPPPYEGPSPTGPLRVTLGSGPPVALPRIGLGWSGEGEALGAREQALLRELRASHLRVDLPMYEEGWEWRLAAASRDAEAIGAQLEVALILGADAEGQLRRLARTVEELRPRVFAWLVFHRDEKSTTPRWVRLVRDRVLPATPAARLGTGTNAFFAELNRGRPPTGVADFVCYSVNPQVHAFDNRSLVETLAAQAATVQTARGFAGKAGIAVTPVTLKPRFNPNATGPEPPPAPGELPPQVDERQMSLFAAGWTVGSLKYLSESGAESVTYFETVGWRGVMQGPKPPPLPDRFRTLPGEVFPVWHVLADAGEGQGGKVLPSISRRPLQVESLVLARNSRVRILLANLSDESCVVLIEGRELPPVARVRYLDETSVLHAMQAPEEFRSAGGLLGSRDGKLRVGLLPYGLARIDLNAEGS